MKELVRISDELCIKLVECNFDNSLSKKAFVHENLLKTVHLKPYLEQVKTHFREEYGIIVKPLVLDTDSNEWMYDVFEIKKQDVFSSMFNELYISFDEALEAGLMKACELINK